MTIKAALQRRRLLLAAAAACALPTRTSAAAAATPEVAAVWPQARAIGSGRLRWLGLTIYDAALWSSVDLTRDDWPAQPLALELRYARALPGRRIAERSLLEMRRQGEIEPARAEEWQASMAAAFPDVAAGDRLTGLRQPGMATSLFHNGRLVAGWPDGEFSRRFFAIWLAETTSEPALREALFGGRG